MNEEIKTCRNCGKPFEPKHHNRKFCSIECKHAKRKENARFRKENGISGVSKIEREKLKEKAKKDKLTILD
jgi:hypothetical protein